MLTKKKLIHLWRKWEHFIERMLSLFLNSKSQVPRYKQITITKSQSPNNKKFGNWKIGNWTLFGVLVLHGRIWLRRRIWLLEFKKRKVLLFSLLIILIGLPIVYLSLKYQPQTEAAWFNDSWTYRQTVNITNSGSAQTDFQVSLSIGTSALVNSGKIQSDCDDIRITDVNGKVLPHWVQTGTNACNSSGNSTTVWTKIPSIPTSGVTLYIYYGNPSALNMEDGNKVFTFFDDFSKSSIDSTKWNSSGTVTISSGTIRLAPGRMQNTGNLGSSFVTEYRSRVTSTSYSNSSHIIMGIMDTDQEDGNGYWPFYNSNNTWQEYWRNASNWTSIQNTGTWSTNAWYVIKISRNSNTFTSYVDGSQRYTGTHPGSPAATSYLVAPRVWTEYSGGGDGPIEFDWVFTRKFASTEPTVAAPANEENSPGPVGYWTFDEGQGQTLNDSTSSNLDGTLGATSGSSTDDPTWITEDQCISGKCLRFDGGDYVNVTNGYSNMISGKANFTVEMWVKTTSLAAQQVLWANNGLEIYASIETSGAVRWMNGLDSITTSNTQSTNTWYHLTFVKTGATTAKIYVNGIESADGTLGTTPTISDENLTLGGYGSAGFRFNGFMDDAKVYNYTRTAAQIKTDYASGLANASTNQGTSAVMGAKTQKYLSEGLVGYWKLEETSTPAQDSSGIGTTGAWGGNVASTTGMFGIGASFDGNGDSITIGDNSSLSTTDTNNRITVSAWVYQTAQTNYDRIIESGWANNGSWLLSVNGAYKPAFQIKTGDTQYNSIATSAISLNTWYHVLGVYDGNNVTVYVNGVAQSPTACSNCDIDNNGSNIIISAGDASEGFTGKIDEVRIYNRAFSPKEVSDLYNWAPGPVAYWDFEEGTGTNFYDRSGTGNNSSTFGSAASWSNGKFGNGLKFDGTTNSYGAVTHSSSINISSAYTLSFWFNLASLSDQHHTILDKGAAVGGGNGWRVINQQGGNDLSVQVYQSGAWQTIDLTTGSILAANTWYYGTVTRDVGGTAAIYINGVLRDTSSASYYSLPTNSQDLWIGRSQAYSSGNTHNGLVDDIKIYNYARTTKQIVEDMNAGHPNVGSPVGSALGWWDFDEGVGSTAYNSGSQGSTWNGSLGPGASTPSWSMNGKYGKALTYDGVDETVTFPNNLRSVDTYGGAEGASTITGWIYPTSDNTQRVIFVRIGGWHYFALNASSLLQGMVNDCVGAVNYWPSSNTAISLNQWTHVTAILTGEGYKLYINGKLDRAISNSNLCINDYGNTPSLADNAGVGWDRFQGTIDEFKVYNYELTADEIKTEYNRGSAQVLGTLSDNSTYQPQAANQEYCIPGDSTSCVAPIGRWDFEEGVGSTAYDTSGNGYTAYLTASPPWKPGKNGKAIDINGSTQDARIANTAFGLTGGSFTLETWVKSDAVDASANKRVISYATDASNGYTLAQYVTGSGCDGRWTFEVKKAGTGYAAGCDSANNAQVIAGRWYHLAATFDGGTNTSSLYVNGIKQAAGSGISYSIPGTTGTLYLGSLAGSSWFDGMIDNVKVFNYARSTAQIAWDYNKGAPVAYWDLDEGQGAIAYNFMGVGNTGSISIGPSGTQTAVGTITTASTAWGNGATGKRNYSLNFDGTDDYVSIPYSTTNDPQTAWTLSAWVKRAATGTQHSVIEMYDWTAGKGNYAMRVGSDDKLIAYIVNGAASQNCGTTTTTISSGSWYHLVAAYDSATNTMICYVNGKAEATNTAITYDPMAASVALKIGARGDDAGTKMNGQIDDVKIYNYGLTATQVKDVYNNGAVNFAPSTGAP